MSPAPVNGLHGFVAVVFALICFFLNSALLLLDLLSFAVIDLIQIATISSEIG